MVTLGTDVWVPGLDGPRRAWHQGAVTVGRICGHLASQTRTGNWRPCEEESRVTFLSFYLCSVLCWWCLVRNLGLCHPSPCGQRALDPEWAHRAGAVQRTCTRPWGRRLGHARAALVGSVSPALQVVSRGTGNPGLTRHGQRFAEPPGIHAGTRTSLANRTVPRQDMEQAPARPGTLFLRSQGQGLTAPARGHGGPCS